MKFRTHVDSIRTGPDDADIIELDVTFHYAGHEARIRIRPERPLIGETSATVAAELAHLGQALLQASKEPSRITGASRPLGQ